MIENQRKSRTIHYGLGLCLMLASTTLMAHSKLVSSVPEADSNVSSSPKQIRLNFNENAVLKGLEIRDSNNKAVPIKFKPQDTAMRTHKVTIPTLKKGTYTVNWKIISKDRHPLSGKYQFTVAPDSP